MDVLLIDDEASLRRTLRTTLESMRHTVAEASTGEQALSWLRKQRVDAAFLDLRLGREAGMDLLPQLLRQQPGLAVIVITAHATIASAVEAMRAGAFDYLPKPFTPDQLRVVLERWRRVQRLQHKVADLEEQVRAMTPEADLHSEEPAMRKVLELAYQVAATEGGTLFLDEIGDVPPGVQPKLLRLLQDRCYERVGETKTRLANVRILAATNRDLAAEVAAGRFREDLFYRLNVIEVELPPLRQRPRDILPLARHLLRFFARQTGKEVQAFTPEAETALLRHHWPGNVRELRNAVERAVILTQGPQLDCLHLPGQVGNPPAPRVEVGGAVTLKVLEAEHIRRVVAASATLEEAAATLGIDPSTLFRKRQREKAQGGAPSS